VFAVTLLATGALFARYKTPEVVVHEWGTFTTVAGEDGQAITWLPLGGPTDLPCFVEHFKNKVYKVIGNAEQEGPLEYNAARSALVGTVRMETPVIYFYSPEETNVSVSVRFPKGIITEWYPRAVVNQPNVVPSILDDARLTGGVYWPSVRILPGRVADYPREAADSHYYAARGTESASLSVSGQDEKFLFYRGVASFPSVLSAALNANGSVTVRNLSPHVIPNVVLFDNRAGRISYRIGKGLETAMTIERPSETATLDGLRAQLITMLVDAGLFQKEATAMVETWRDSWFEEGTRVFYILPAGSVNDILPLTISPAPAAVARAFVGRMELITPDALVRVQTAFNRGDDAALEREGRFLGPIADRLIARTTNVSERNKIRAVTNTVFSAYVKRFGGCR
jgi:hypothetical protein